MSQSDAPTMTTLEEVPAILQIVSTNGNSIAYEGGISWISSDPKVFSAHPNPKDGREAIIRSEGPGTATLVVSGTIRVGGDELTPFEAAAIVSVEAAPGGGFTATIEWSDPRPKSAEEQAA